MGGGGGVTSSSLAAKKWSSTIPKLNSLIWFSGDSFTGVYYSSCVTFATKACLWLVLVFIFVVSLTSALSSSNTMEPCPAHSSSGPPHIPCPPLPLSVPIFLHPATSTPYLVTLLAALPETSLFCFANHLLSDPTLPSPSSSFQCSSFRMVLPLFIASSLHCMFITGWWRQSLVSIKPWWSWSISPVTLGFGTLTT